jgi:SAM-dependent methyltransferase
MVTGADGLRWLELLVRLQRRCALEPSEKVMADELTALGLCNRDQDDIHLTAFGATCAASAREYLFWIRRDRKLHGEDTQPIVRLENFRDKSVLEIGSGWGCNLVRLASVARRAVGVEIEPNFIEFSRILSKREGIDPPDIRLAAGESTPFGPGEFDWVLLFSALQFMDIGKALRETARLLRPGGYALTTQKLFSDFVGASLRDVVYRRNAQLLLSALSIAANTLWYQCFGKRLRDNVKGDSTSRPIHPTKAYLITTGERAGLRFCKDLSVQLGWGEFGFVFQKPA